MSRLDDYRTALLVALPAVTDAELGAALQQRGAQLVSFIVDHGLGPLWHARTGRAEFHASRLSAEALYLSQQHALIGMSSALEAADIDYAVIKGAATRLLLYESAALRACHDLDLLVRTQDRARAAIALTKGGFVGHPDARHIGHELVLRKASVDIDLHWRLLREGRLRDDCAADMLDRRQRANGMWMLNAEDALFVLLVHPAISKHLAGWGMGLHRVLDVVTWLATQSFDWPAVCARLEENGVRTAAWATLRWVELLTIPNSPPRMSEMMSDIRPGPLRRRWLDRWLRSDLPARTSGVHWARLLGFSLFLHDAPGDVRRALAGRYRSQRRQSADLAAFRDLVD